MMTATGRTPDARWSNEPAEVHRGTWQRGGMADGDTRPTANGQGLARWVLNFVVGHKLHHCIP
jgi:hypothetical protein